MYPYYCELYSTDAGLLIIQLAKKSSVLVENSVYQDKIWQPATYVQENYKMAWYSTNTHTLLHTNTDVLCEAGEMKIAVQPVRDGMRSMWRAIMSVRMVKMRRTKCQS